MSPKKRRELIDTLKRKDPFVVELDTKWYPFDVFDFYVNNMDLVKKYLRKNTTNVIISEDYEVPEEWQYKSNAAVVDSKVVQEFTDLQKLEIIKCSFDPIYFARKYIRVINIDGGVVPFDMYDCQEDMIRGFHENRFVVACTGRQIGKTTTAASYILWYAMFHKAKPAAVLANKADQAQEIIERIQTSYEELPLFLKVGIRVYNKRSMTFVNKSKVFSAASSKSAIRGKSISLLYWDEVAFTDNDVTFYEAIFPTISSGETTKFIVTSTPNGKRGVFYKIWSEAPGNGFHPIFIKWDQIPWRDEKWAQSIIKATSYEQFLQEHCAEFRGSENAILSGETLMRLAHHQPIKTINGDLRIFKNPVKGNTYVIVCDVSRGVGLDYHAFSVVDVSNHTYEVVATYRNNQISSLLYPSLIFNVANHYNEAHVLVEINDIGEQVANILYYELEYENVLTVHTRKNRQVIGFSQDSKMGIRTTASVKSIGCANVKTMVEKDKLILNDERLIDEFSTFVPKGKSYAAENGAHDDMVMTMVLFGWLSTQPYFVDISQKDIRRKLLSDQGSNEESLFPFAIDSNEFGSYGHDSLIRDDLDEFHGNPQDDDSDRDYEHDLLLDGF